MKKGLVFLAVFAFLIGCTGCDGYDVLKKYPEYKATRWYCEEIDFRFEYHYSEDGILEHETFPLNWGGESLDVTIWFITDFWYIDYDKDGDLCITPEEQLLSGTWTYQRGNLLLQIEKDNLFGGQYTHLIFIPMQE